MVLLIEREYQRIVSPLSILLHDDRYAKGSKSSLEF